MMGLAVASVGNHEFDEGKDELLRMQNGGCHPTTNVRARVRSPAPGFTTLRLHDREGHRQDGISRLRDQEFEGIPVAFIGLTLKGTPNIVSPVGVAGLEFRTRLKP